MNQTPDTSLPNNARAKRPAHGTGKAIVWNDKEILKASGGSPESVQKLMDEINQPRPSTWAVYQWASRKRIPDLWRPRLVYALMRRNHITVNQLFAVESDNNTPDADNDNHSRH